MADALVGLGGNVGDVRPALAEAIALFADGGEVKLIARSSDYLTAPWGGVDQPPFVNCTIHIETTLTPRALLTRALNVERALGRNRAGEQRWGPRTVDIDILAYDDLRLDEPGLTLPHPHLFERAFVLVPLAEIVPDRLIGGRRVREAAAAVGNSGIERLAEGS